MNKSKAASEPVSDLKSHVGFWMRFVSNHVSQAFARKLVKSGVTVAEWVVLREMYGRDEMSPSKVADLTGMTRGAASKLIDRLVDKNLIHREERADDRRYQDIGLTAAGVRLVPSLAALADSNDQEFFGALTATERQTLLAIVKKLVLANDLHKLPTQ
ncbi:MarR family winged helix-turn-helix transcriptional regulator [Bradyrhizobium sp.]|uniref:MarR family winged helix-turn-helix transcriptional regulator n=1 Tax=Bradyrhizobium sp. TaxID=376 RepID=UPI003C4F2BDE